MLNSVVAAQGGHDFISRGWEVKTEGNPLNPYDPERSGEQTWQHHSQLSL